MGMAWGLPNRQRFMMADRHPECRTPSREVRVDAAFCWWARSCTSAGKPPTADALRAMSVRMVAFPPLLE